MSVDTNAKAITINSYGIRTNGFVPYNSGFYMNTKSGGFNGAIIPSESCCSKANVLCNCVGFANGAFNEAYCALTGKTPKCYFQLTSDGCNFINRANGNGTLKNYVKPAWDTPPLGGIIVWGGGLNHVAYIADVKSKDEIVIVQAGYGTPAWTVKNKSDTGYVCDVRTIYRNDGGINRWAYCNNARSAKDGYVLGYIANPGFSAQPGTPIGPMPYNPYTSIIPAIPDCGPRVDGVVHTPHIYINNQWVKADMLVYDGTNWMKAI